MKKIVIKGITEENLEVIALKLSELGVNPGPLYNSIKKNRQEAIVEVDESVIRNLNLSLQGICEIIPLQENTSQHPSLLILSIFLENLFLFYILKLSIWTEEFHGMLSNLFASSGTIIWIKILLSLSCIVLYYHAFFNSRGAPLVSVFLGISFKKDKQWLTLAYSLPLVALYLMSTGITLFKFLGFGLLSLSFALVLYSER